jgi:deoxyribodipyrimidine photo-lyase
MSTPIIYWYRNDLRLSDLRGMAHAAASGRPVLACYILDEVSQGAWRPGGASRWWLHQSLLSLSRDIEASGGRLYLARGEPAQILADLARQSGATDIYCCRQYEPWAAQLEERVYRKLATMDVSLKRFSGTLLWEPEIVANKAGTPFKVFTPFWRNCLTRDEPALPLGRPDKHTWYQGAGPGGALQDWQLIPSRPDWSQGWEEVWQPGEAGANAQLEAFLSHRVGDYGAGRDHPAQASTSLLSAHLHFGEISPARVFHRTREAIAVNPALAGDGEKFLSEVGWREFSHHLLFHFPHIPEKAFKVNFDAFPWVGSRDNLERWQQGLTGYPLVDAGMRELWATGYMHNRVRMLAASFLCKHLLIDWRAGQAWFWDTLVDADLANNACGWQWVAGSGADASPYFRIFNPVTQAQKFDRAGDYIKRWIPELSALPDRYIHQPWEAPEAILGQCGVRLGETYPLPLVDHRHARESALAAYGEVRASPVKYNE